MRDKNQRLNNISIVIITKNEEHVLDKTLASLQGITDNIIIVDSGSTDDTITIAKKHSENIIHTTWLGYGKTKNKGIENAKYDWIFSVDADEAVDKVLKEELLKLNLAKEDKSVFKVKRKNFIGEKKMNYGEWANDYQIRLFNKKTIQWDDSPVHEQLQIPPGFKVKKLNGALLHYTMKDFKEFLDKIHHYAFLSAQKYFSQSKKALWYKLYLSPSFTFILNYFFKLGFLDGWRGFVSAKFFAYYTFLKYALLKDLESMQKK